jgi:hypothetical protein
MSGPNFWAYFLNLTRCHGWAKDPRLGLRLGGMKHSHCSPDIACHENDIFLQNSTHNSLVKILVNNNE